MKHNESFQKAIETWKKWLGKMGKGETVKILCGVANCDFFRAVYNDLKKAKKRGVIIKMIAGPIISKEENGSSAVLELAAAGIIKLWISPYRQQQHFVIFGGRFYVEDDAHKVLSNAFVNKGVGYDINSARLGRLFDGIIEALELKFFNLASFAWLTKEEIANQKKERGCNFDFMNLKDLKAA